MVLKSSEICLRHLSGNPVLYIYVSYVLLISYFNLYAVVTDLISKSHRTFAYLHAVLFPAVTQVRG